MGFISDVFNLIHIDQFDFGSYLYEFSIHNELSDHMLWTFRKSKDIMSELMDKQSQKIYCHRKLFDLSWPWAFIRTPVMNSMLLDLEFIIGVKRNTLN